jgi:hypothetical protein
MLSMRWALLLLKHMQKRITINLGEELNYGKG